MALKRAMVGVIDAEARCMGPVSAQTKALRAENIFARFLRFLDEMVGKSGFKGVCTERISGNSGLYQYRKTVCRVSKHTQETFDDL